MAKTQRPGRRRGLVIILALVLVVGAVLVIPLACQPPEEPPPGTQGPALEELVAAGPTRISPESRINILVLGLDEPFGGERVGRSDVNIVVSLDPVLDEASLLWLPRDSRVAIPGRGVEKLGHAHAYAGRSLAKQTVENWLGVTIHHTVSVDMRGFEAIIDAMGGVEVDVDEATAELLEIEPGLQQLDGRNTLRLVRRRPTSDIERIQRQQMLATALKTQLLRQMTASQMLQLAWEVARHVRWDIPVTQVPNLVQQARSLDRDRIDLAILPGRGALLTENGQSIHYWLTEPEVAQELGDRRIIGLSPRPEETLRIGLVAKPEHADLAADIAARLTVLGYEVVAPLPEPQPGEGRLEIPWEAGRGVLMAQSTSVDAEGVPALAAPPWEVELLTRLVERATQGDVIWLALNKQLLGGMETGGVPSLIIRGVLVETEEGETIIVPPEEVAEPADPNAEEAVPALEPVDLVILIGDLE